MTIGLSIKVIKKLIWAVHDVELITPKNKKVFKRSFFNEQLKLLLDKLKMCY